MVNSDKSIFEYKISPFIQGGAVLGAIIVFLVFTILFGKIGLDVDEGTPWLVACSLTFFYVIGNTILSLAADDQNTYWWQSILTYVLLVVLGASAAYLFSGSGMDSVGSYRWLYVVFAIGHVLFLAIARTMKKLVTIAKKQDRRLRGEE